MTAYDFFKDFAAPIATIAAALGALTVTAIFASKQADYAKQQAETAKNKLKLDLFEKRLIAFKEVEKLYQYAMGRKYNKAISNTDLYDLSGKAYDCYFIFPSENFEEIKQVVQLSLNLISAIESFPDPSSITSDQRKLQEETKSSLHISFDEMRTNLNKVIGLHFN